MAIRSLITALLPHRMAGGIGLLMIGAGLASVKFPAARPAPVNTATVASGGTDLRNRMQRAAQDSVINTGNESDVAYRSFSPATDALPPFRVTDLSASLGAREQLDILAVSQGGAVLGTVMPARDNSALPGAKRLAPRTYAARWNNGTLQRFPIPPNTDRVIAGDMNDRGDVVAVSIRYRRGKPPFNHVILYDSSAAYQDLGTLDVQYAQKDTDDSAKMRGVSENLLCLNNRGTVVALVGSKSWFRRSDGVKAPIGNGVAFDLNNDDTAVGFVGAYASGAVLWRNITVPQKSSMMPLLPNRGAEQRTGQSYWRGSGDSVNDKGDTVVSVPIDSSNGLRRLGRTAYYLLRDGKLQLIAQMRGYQRTRVRINDSGDVVGFTDTDAQSQTVSPFLYRNGKMYDLTNVASKAQWKIVGAVDINNRRQILAYGVRVDREDVVLPILLTPAGD